MTDTINDTKHDTKHDAKHDAKHDLSSDNPDVKMGSPDIPPQLQPHSEPQSETPSEIKAKTKACPACGQIILEEAIKCRFCKTDLNETRSEDGMSSSQATFFYISILFVFGLILFFTKSVNLAFILTSLYSLILYLSLDKKNKK
jgi:uncharacterized protein (DUF983 family)